MSMREDVYVEEAETGPVTEPPSNFVKWVIGAAVVCAVMGLGMIYLVQLYVGVRMREVVMRHAIERSGPVVLKLVTPEDLESPITGDRYAQLDQNVKDFVLVGDVVRLKLWSPSGTVVYSSYAKQIGESQSDHKPFIDAIQGSVSWEVKREPESALDWNGEEILEVYVPLFQEPGGGGSGVMEAVVDYQPYAAQMQRIRYIILGASAAVLLTIVGAALAVSRSGSKSILKERDIAVQRHREVVALNRFLQHDIERTRDLQEKLQSLRRDLLGASPSSEDSEALSARYVRLTNRIGELAVFSEPLFTAEDHNRGE